MKIIAAALLAALFSASAAAQNVTPGAGFSATTLFDAGSGFGGFDLDSSGDVFYLGGSLDTQLLRATAAANYNDPTPIADFGASVFGNFVKLQGSTVFYGESTLNGIYAASTSVPQTPPAPAKIATVAFNYDLAFSGSSGYVSANPTGFKSPTNTVYQMNLSTGVTQTVLVTGDYSGPVAIEPEAGQSVGDLIYGVSGSVAGPSAPGNGIYLFSSAKVQMALNTGTTLGLSDGVKIFDTPGNSYFALNGNDLYQALSSFSNQPSTLTLFDLSTMTSTLIGTTPAGDFFSGMTYADGSLYVAVTDGDLDTTIVQLVPEPGSLGLCVLGAGAVAFTGRGRRRLKTG